VPDFSVLFHRFLSNVSPIGYDRVQSPVTVTVFIIIWYRPTDNSPHHFGISQWFCFWDRPNLDSFRHHNRHIRYTHQIFRLLQHIRMASVLPEGLNASLIISIYTVFQRKEATKLLAVTLSNLNRFEKFFH